MQKECKPELVAPAGDWPSLRAAVLAGADSVYFGLTSLNMRNLSTNFDLLELQKVMSFLHAKKKKGYLALNVPVFAGELPLVKKIITHAKKVGVDAIIAWDMSVITLARQHKMRVHISTQASIANSAAVTAFARLGARRVVLARECSLRDVALIARQLSKSHSVCELEVFVHGAMCISISGRCFLSLYRDGKSANRGECLQPCRREYAIKEINSDYEYIIGRDYLLSAQDLCTIDFIDELLRLPIAAFKIEGRMRSAEYVRIVVEAYREAIDAYDDGRLTAHKKRQLKLLLQTVYNRGFTSGFYFGKPTSDATGGTPQHLYEKKFIGEVRKFYKHISVAEILIRNTGLRTGSELLFLGKKTPAHRATVEEIQLNHRTIEAPQQGDVVGVKVPFVVQSKDKVFLWQKKSL